MVPEFETKNAHFGSITDEKIKQHHMSVSSTKVRKLFFELFLVSDISKISIYPQSI